MPESFFATQENLGARLFLFAHFNVKAVVSLPRHAFEPWTPTRTSLLFAQKKSVEEERAWKDVVVPVEVKGTQAKAVASRACRRVRRLRLGLIEGKLRERITKANSELGRRGHSLSELFPELSLAQLEDAVKSWEAAREEETSRGAPKELLADVNEVVGGLRELLSEVPRLISESRVAFETLGVVDDVDAGARLEEIAVACAKAHDAVRGVDVRILGFRAAAEAMPMEFNVATVENIGYKRTKRGETERQNDLFSGFVDVPVEGSIKRVRVRNLNLSGEGWYIEAAGDAKDLLSVLAGKNLWE